MSGRIGANPWFFSQDFMGLNYRNGLLLAEVDQRADATPFIEFMLGALGDAIRETLATDQVSDYVTDQVGLLIAAIGTGELGSKNLMKTLSLSHRPTFRENYLNPALEGGWIERTQPDSPRSPTQRYRLSNKGHQWLQQHKDGQGRPPATNY